MPSQIAPLCATAVEQGIFVDCRAGYGPRSRPDTTSGSEPTPHHFERGPPQKRREARSGSRPECGHARAVIRRPHDGGRLLRDGYRAPQSLSAFPSQAPTHRASLPGRSAESRGMSDRPQKITFSDMRDMGVRGLLICCSDYKMQPPDHHERRSVARPHAAVRSRAALHLHGLRRSSARMSGRTSTGTRRRSR